MLLYLYAFVQKIFKYHCKTLYCVIYGEKAVIGVFKVTGVFAINKNNMLRNCNTHY